jgi:glycopeptide antibiotics resistance protein
MDKGGTAWHRWIGVGVVVMVLSIIALGHNGHGSGPSIRLIPFREYIETTSGLLQGWDGARAWLVFTLVDGLGNLVVFMPLGAALDYALRDKRGPTLRRIGIITLLGALLSVSYETIQLWIPGRVTAIDDVIINTTGTALGAVLVIALRSRRQQVAQKVI